MYQYGLGVSKDETEAVKWYRKSAEQGNAFGQNNLGAMYEYGNGVNKDILKAVSWYRKAAEQGHNGAIENLKRNGYPINSR
jgi:TPR repeat protein